VDGRTGAEKLRAERLGNTRRRLDAMLTGHTRGDRPSSRSGWW
jgi:hypothetical protein